MTRQHQQAQTIPAAKGRGLLVALFACLHFGAVPCAMAMTSPPPDGDCERCDVVIEQAPCIMAADPACTDEAFGLNDRLRDPPGPTTEPSLILPPPHATAQPGLRATVIDIRAAATGRHTGDPPLHLLNCNFRK